MEQCRVICTIVGLYMAIYTEVHGLCIKSGYFSTLIAYSTLQSTSQGRKNKEMSSSYTVHPVYKLYPVYCIVSTDNVSANISSFQYTYNLIHTSTNESCSQDAILLYSTSNWIWIRNVYFVQIIDGKIHTTLRKLSPIILATNSLSFSNSKSLT